jgi:hypothetical protein
MTALICGSIAYDNIMVFEDSFRNHILPDQIHILNVAFLVPELRREFGGCAINIAYNLKLLGEDPLPMGTAGRDFEPYRQWLDQLRIRQDCIRVLDDVFTAQAFITTDLDDNQITAFHPGAMNFSHENRIHAGIFSFRKTKPCRPSCIVEGKVQFIDHITTPALRLKNDGIMPRLPKLYRNRFSSFVIAVQPFKPVRLAGFQPEMINQKILVIHYTKGKIVFSLFFALHVA